MSETSQEFLAQYTQKRDPEAFRELVGRHQDMVYAACRRILKNAADAEDAAQTCFLKLARKPEHITGSVAGWLHRSATNAAIDLVRREQALKAREAYAMELKPTDETSSWRRVSDTVDEAIDQLPEELRIPIIRYYLDRANQQEIASELGVTHSAISKRLQRGIEELRGRLSKSGIALSAALLATLLAQNAAEAAPATLAASLGKMALASVAKSSVAGAASVGTKTFMGGIVMKTSIALGIVAMLAAGGITVHNLFGQTPPPTASAATQRTTADSTQQKYVLEHVYTPGDYRLTLNVDNMNTTLVPGGQEYLTNIQNDFVIRITAGSPDADGSTPFTIRYECYRITFESGGVITQFDSTTPDDTPQDPDLSLVGHALMNMNVVILLDADGEVQSMTGSDEVWEKLAQDNPDNPWIAQIKQSLGAEFYKGLLRPGKECLTGNPIAIGDTWKVSSEETLPAVGESELSYDCTFKKLEKSKDENYVAFIEFQGDCKVHEGGEIIIGNGMPATITSGEYTYEGAFRCAMGQKLIIAGMNRVEGGIKLALSTPDNQQMVIETKSNVLSQLAIERVEEAESSKFSATLPGGGIIELLGVSYHPSEGRPWWKPDGTPHPVGFITSGSHSYPDPNSQSREFVLRLEGLPEGSSTPTWKLVPPSSWASGRAVPDLAMISASLPKSAKSVDLKVGVAIAPWEDIAESLPDQSWGGGSQIQGIEVSFTHGYEQEGKATVTVGHNIQEQNFRLIAIDLQDQEYKGNISSTSVGTFTHATSKFNLPLDQVKLFRLQSRPYHWVEFRNVPLEPLVEIRNAASSDSNNPRVGGKASRLMPSSGR